MFVNSSSTTIIHHHLDDPIWDITRNRLLIKKPLHNSLKDDTLQSQQHDHVHKVPMSIVPVA